MNQLVFHDMAFMDILSGSIGNWFVVWNIFLFFPYIGNFIIPIDFHISQRGRYTTNQVSYQVIYSATATVIFAMVKRYKNPPYG